MQSQVSELRFGAPHDTCLMQPGHLIDRHAKFGQDCDRMLPDDWWRQPELRRGRGETGSRRRLNDVIARDESAAGDVVRMLRRLGQRQDGKDTSVDVGEELLDGATGARGELRTEPTPKCR